MKLTIERGALLKSLTHVQGVVERRTTIPILSNVLIRAQENALGLTATDMDIAIVERTAADVPQEGTTTVPAHTLYDIVRKLPEGSQVEDRERRRAGPASAPVRTVEVPPGRIAERGLPGDGRRRPPARLQSEHGGPARPDRPHLRFAMVDGGDAVLPERHLPAHGRDRRRAGSAHRGDRRAPSGAGRDAAAGRRGRHAPV